MPSKPRSLAGILRSRRHADAEYNRARRDPVVARIHGSARWQAVRAQVLRDEPVCRECARLGLTEPATQVDHVLPLAVAPGLAFDRANLAPTCTPCHSRKSVAERGGEGGPADSHALGAPSGARGVSLFSRDRGNARNGPQSPDSSGGPRTQPAGDDGEVYA
jgi:5-methylcytosine-specific restriction protein A